MTYQRSYKNQNFEVHWLSRYNDPDLDIQEFSWNGAWNLPAQLHVYYTNGLHEWIDKFIHRDDNDKPAYIEDSCMKWMQHGKLYRQGNKPIVIVFNRFTMLLELIWSLDEQDGYLRGPSSIVCMIVGQELVIHNRVCRYRHMKTMPYATLQTVHRFAHHWKHKKRIRHLLLTLQHWKDKNDTYLPKPILRYHILPYLYPASHHYMNPMPTYEQVQAWIVR